MRDIFLKTNGGVILLLLRFVCIAHRKAQFGAGSMMGWVNIDNGERSRPMIVLVENFERTG